MRRRVTFSRNVTLSLSRSCVSHCKYCAFATHRPHLHEPDEVERLIDRAARRGVKELLVLTGDDPASVPGVGERLAALGFEDFVAYVVWSCERALERGLLPHTNLGALRGEDLAEIDGSGQDAGDEPAEGGKQRDDEHVTEAFDDQGEPQDGAEEQTNVSGTHGSSNLSSRDAGVAMTRQQPAGGAGQGMAAFHEHPLAAG